MLWLPGLQTVKRVQTWLVVPQLVGSWTLCLVVVEYMPFEVRVVRIHLTVYHPGSLYISILAVIVMYSIGPKFVFFHGGP